MLKRKRKKTKLGKIIYIKQAINKMKDSKLNLIYGYVKMISRIRK